MYDILLPYFENVGDGTAQGDFLKDLGNNETQGGICLHLSITWLHSCAKNAAAYPNEIWREMKNPTLIKQIANNQRAYQQQGYSIEENVQLATNKQLSATKLTDFLNVEELLGLSVASRMLYVIYFENKAHALASVRKDDKFYLFDPNVGVMTVPVVNKDELLSKVYTIYESIFKMKITKGVIYDIQ